jgi:hypothetical protein
VNGSCTSRPRKLHLGTTDTAAQSSLQPPPGDCRFGCSQTWSRTHTHRAVSRLRARSFVKAGVWFVDELEQLQAECFGVVDHAVSAHSSGSEPVSSVS